MQQPEFHPPGRSSIIRFKRRLLLIGIPVILFWLLEAVDYITPFWTMDQYGIQPRSFIGLRGIIFAPFLHGDFAHVAANSIPFLILGGLIVLRKPSDFIFVTFLAAVTTGLGTWLFAAPFTVHVGASGLVFGYFGYLLMLGYYERSATSILRSLVILVLYGGILWGILPTQSGISWEGHLFGLVGGIFSAWLLAERPQERLRNQITILDDDLP